jgi:hypothetical protein
MSKNQVLAFLKTNRQFIAEKYGVTKIGMFGSFAREENKPDSDIDIAVEIESTNKFRSFFD